MRRCAGHCGPSEGRPSSGPAWGSDCPAGEKAEHAGHMGDEIARVTMSQGSMWLIAKWFKNVVVIEHGNVCPSASPLSPAGPAVCPHHPGETPLMNLIQHRYSASQAKSFKFRSHLASQPPEPPTLEPKDAEMLKRTCYLVSVQPTSLPCPSLSLKTLLFL